MLFTRIKWLTKHFICSDFDSWHTCDSRNPGIFDWFDMFLRNACACARVSYLVRMSLLCEIYPRFELEREENVLKGLMCFWNDGNRNKPILKSIEVNECVSIWKFTSTFDSFDSIEFHFIRNNNVFDFIFLTITKTFHNNRASEYVYRH